MEDNEMEMDSSLGWTESGGLKMNRNIVTILTMELDILEYSFAQLLNSGVPALVFVKLFLH